MKLDWKAILGLVLSGLLLWWVLGDVDFAEVWLRIRRAHPWYFLGAVAVTTSSFLVRAWRWKVLLHPIRPGSRFHPRFAAVNIGFMTNNLLPARAGEFARAYALSRMEDVTASGSLGSLVVERVLDGIVLILLLLFALAWPTFPAGLDVAGGRVRVGILVLAAIFIGAAVILFALVRWPAATVDVAERVVSPFPGSVRRLVVDLLDAFCDGLGVLGDPVLFLRAFLWTVGLWAWHGVSFWLGFRAFGIEADYVAALFLQTLTALAVAVPSAPGFFGPFEAATRVALVNVYGVAVGPALSFALGWHIGGFIPVTLIGLFYAWRLGLTLREVEESEELVEEAVEREHPRPPGRSRSPTRDGGSGKRSREKETRDA